MGKVTSFNFERSSRGSDQIPGTGWVTWWTESEVSGSHTECQSSRTPDWLNPQAPVGLIIYTFHRVVGRAMSMRSVHVWAINYSNTWTGTHTLVSTIPGTNSSTSTGPASGVAGTRNQECFWGRPRFISPWHMYGKNCCSCMWYVSFFGTKLLISTSWRTDFCGWLLI